MIGTSKLNTKSLERAQIKDTAPVRARPDCGAAGGTCRCDSGTSDLTT
jgi:hypothetical protein